MRHAGNGEAIHPAARRDGVNEPRGVHAANASGPRIPPSRGVASDRERGTR
jgi:hypothetical protein